MRFYKSFEMRETVNMVKYKNGKEPERGNKYYYMMNLLCEVME